MTRGRFLRMDSTVNKVKCNDWEGFTAPPLHKKKKQNIDNRYLLQSTSTFDWLRNDALKITAFFRGKAKWTLLRILCKAPSKALWATFQVSGPLIILFATTVVGSSNAECRVSGYYAERVWTCRRKLPGKAKLRISRKHREDSASIAIGSAVSFEIGTAVGTYRYHAVVNTLSPVAQKNSKADQVRGGRGGGGRETRLVHYSGGGCTAGPSGRIGDPRWNDEKSKNPNTRGTRPPPYPVSDAAAFNISSLTSTGGTVI